MLLLLMTMVTTKAVAVVATLRLRPHWSARLHGRRAQTGPAHKQAATTTKRTTWTKQHLTEGRCRRVIRAERSQAAAAAQLERHREVAGTGCSGIDIAAFVAVDWHG
jgi:hypothetical protein